MGDNKKLKGRDLTLDVATNAVTSTAPPIAFRYDEDAWKELKKIIDRNNELLEELGENNGSTPK